MLNTIPSPIVFLLEAHGLRLANEEQQAELERLMKEDNIPVLYSWETKSLPPIGDFDLHPRSGDPITGIGNFVRLLIGGYGEGADVVFMDDPNDEWLEVVYKVVSHS